MSLRSSWQLFLFRWREFLRTPEIIFWVLVFPCLTLLVLGMAFRPAPPEPIPVLVAVAPGDLVAEALAKSLEGPDLRVLRAEPDAAQLGLRRGEAALLVRPSGARVGEVRAGDVQVSAPGAPVLQGDPTNPETRAARLLVKAALAKAAGQPPPPGTDEQVTARGARYIDWLVPGLLGMQIMNGSLWGLGFGLVEVRAKKLLKRFAVTPMSRLEFLLAHAAQRFVVVALEAVVMFVFARLVFDVPMEGSWLAFALAAGLGTLAFCGIGVLVAARPRTTEVAAMVMNLPMLPQMILSGVFFSAARFPDWFQPFVQALPLTALNDAMRAVQNEGAGLSGIAHELLILAVWSVVTWIVGLKLFRWT